MKNLNISGNVGKDAVVRQTSDGTSVANFSVAVEDRKGREKSTMWFDVSLWGKRGEALAQYITKGTKVSVCGDLSAEEHEGRTYLKIRADSVTLMGGGQRDDRDSYQHQGGAPAGGADMNDEIPF